MRLKLLIVLVLSATCLHAQTFDRSPFRELNNTRIKTNTTGMKVLGAWGTASLVTGAAGYFIATDNEWKAFHGMNAIWGATNLLIAYGGYAGARKEAKTDISCDKALHRYESNKRLFLINGGLDFVYIGAGLLLTTNANNFNNPATFRGFGRSITIQGIGLLIFDGTMYAMHQKQDKKWYKLLQGVCVTGNGLGYRYTF
jgi:hypothetical protein